MKISIAIMAHPSREEQVNKLYTLLHAMPFTCITPVYDDGRGEWVTGERSLLSHDDSDWHIVIQDDAIISDTFYANALQAILNTPEPTLLSFYTGTVRPHEIPVTKAIEIAMSEDASYLSFNTLCWGVAFAIPTPDIKTVLYSVRYNRLPYDWRIGSYYTIIEKQVYYTFPSIVDHDYTIDSLLKHDISNMPRKAHVYSEELQEFSGGIIKI